MRRHRRFKYVYSPCFLSQRIDWFVHRLLPLAMVQLAVILACQIPRRFGARLVLRYGLFLQRHSPRWGVLSEHWQSRIDLPHVAAERYFRSRSWASSQHDMIVGVQHDMIAAIQREVFGVGGYGIVTGCRFVHSAIGKSTSPPHLGAGLSRSQVPIFTTPLPEPSAKQYTRVLN